MEEIELCKYPDCGRSERFRGYCQKHYYQLLRSGELPRVRRKTILPPAERLKQKYVIAPVSGCWIWLAGLNNGYAVIGLNDGWNAKASHVSYEARHGRIPDGMMVLHQCDNPKCINPDHLFLGNNTDNMRDCSRKGRTAGQRGTNNHRLRLESINTARILYARGTHSAEELARILGFGRQTVYNFLKGRTHLDDPCAVQSGHQNFVE